MDMGVGQVFSGSILSAMSCSNSCIDFSQDSLISLFALSLVTFIPRNSEASSPAPGLSLTTRWSSGATGLVEAVLLLPRGEVAAPEVAGV